MKPQSISLKEYYLWSEWVETRAPWQRQNLNYDFLKYEQKRILELSNWYDIFKKADRNSQLNSASFYVKPMTLNHSWKAAISECGNFNYVGLSALCSSPPLLLMGLIPLTDKQPLNHKLINITKSKKLYLINRLLNEVEWILLIEEWDYLKSDSIYVDVKSENKIISKIIEENLINDEQISQCFQSPILSAPFDGAIGGISVSSLSCSSTFGKELAKTLQLMVPPEYRTIPPPKSLFNGHHFQYTKGVEFHLAERPYFDDNVLSSIYTKQYSQVKKELTSRKEFNGEFSVFSSINSPYGNSTQMLQEFWKNFTETEITLSQEIDKLPVSDVDITQLNKVINEDIWIQVVKSRRCNPVIRPEDENKFIKNIEKGLWGDFDVLLPEIYKDDSREHLIQKLVTKSKGNLIRIAQSTARAENKEQLKNTHLKNARNLILDNFTDLLNSSDVVKTELKHGKKTRNPRYTVVQAELINNNQGLITNDILEGVKSTNLFKDIYDLQRFLDWLDDNGFVSLDVNKKYRWVGRHVS